MCRRSDRLSTSRDWTGSRRLGKKLVWRCGCRNVELGSLVGSPPFKRLCRNEIMHVIVSQMKYAILASACAFQNRGNRNIFSHYFSIFSGRVFIIREKTKKCIGMFLMSKTCRICEFSKKICISPKEHNCCRNWSGSVNSMYRAMACEMPQDVINQGQRVCFSH